MARSQLPGDLLDFWREFEDIKRSKRQDEDEEEMAKTPDEGEPEAAWLQEAGYGFLASRFHAGKELSEDEIHTFTESLPSNHAAVVKRRVDTLNATLRKKQKYSTKIDVRNIFPQEPQSGTTIVCSQSLEYNVGDTKQKKKHQVGLKKLNPMKNTHPDNIQSQSHLKSFWPDNVLGQGNWKNTSPDNVQGHGHWKNTSPDNVQGHGHWKNTCPDNAQGHGHWKNTSADNGQSGGYWTNLSPDLDKGHNSRKTCARKTEAVPLEGYQSPTREHVMYVSTDIEGHSYSLADCVYFKRTENKDLESPFNSPKRSRSSSCDTLDSLDSGLESSGSLLNPDNSSSHDSLDTVDSVSCFPKKGPFIQKLGYMSPGTSLACSYSPVKEIGSPLETESPIANEGESSPTLLAFRKRQNSLTEMPKSPVSPRGEVVHPEWNVNRNRASKGPFMKNKGGYSMSGVSEEVQDNVEFGVEMLSVHQKGTVQKRWSQLSPISDADITFEFSIEENGGEQGHNDRTAVTRVDSFDLPNFSLVQDKLGLTNIDDISEADISLVKHHALLELTSMYDTHNITYSQRRTKKRQREHGIFGVPLPTMLEQDEKLKPNSRIPLVFQEIMSYLVKHCLDTEGILRIPGSTSRIKQLRQELEERFYQGTFIWGDDLTANDVAALMKQFLRELPTPLLSDEYIEAFAQVDDLPDKKQQLHALNLLILLLPNIHRDTLSALLEFLEKIIERSNTNKMSLNNVAMIMAPNLFMTPKVRSSNPARNKVALDLEIKMAANTSTIMKMLIRYRSILWTVPTYLIALVRRQYELEQLRKNKDKSKMKGLLSKKDRTEVYKQPALKHEADFQDGVIRIQAPNLTKSSTAIQLDNHTTAGDIVSKFRVIQGTHNAPNKSNGSSHPPSSLPGTVYNDPRNFHSAGKDTFLFEMGGNIGERCLPNNTNMLALYKVNPNADWIIKQRERFKVT